MNYPPQQIGQMPFFPGALPQANLPTLYVGDLDEFVTEAHLREAFGKYGAVFSVRVMRSTGKGTSRGYGFVTFYSQQDAFQAREATNHTKIIEQGKPMRVLWKKQIKELDENANIFVKHLDPHTETKDLEKYFSTFGDILSCKIKSDDRGFSRGYGYVQFKDKESADRCLEAIKNDPNVLAPVAEKGKTLIASRFENSGKRGGREANLCKVYIFNLGSLKVDDEKKLEDFIEKSGYKSVKEFTVKKTENQKSKNFGHIKFDSLDEAKLFLNNNAFSVVPFEKDLYVLFYDVTIREEFTKRFEGYENFKEVEFKSEREGGDHAWARYEFGSVEEADKALGVLRETQIINHAPEDHVEIERFGNILFVAQPVKHLINELDNFPEFGNVVNESRETRKIKNVDYLFKRVTFAEEAAASKYVDKHFHHAFDTFAVKLSINDKSTKLPKETIDQFRNQTEEVATTARFVRIKDKAVRRFDDERNVFFKSADVKLTSPVIIQKLSELGYKVDSVKISFNETGESRGYGFILFSTKEDALKFIQNKPTIGSAPIEANNFEKRLLKDKSGRTILFTKGYPHKENELDLLLQHAKEIYGQFGELKLTKFKYNEKQKKYFGFIEFKLQDACAKALEELEYNHVNPFIQKYVQIHPEYEKNDNMQVRLYLDYAEPVKKLFYLVDMVGHTLPENLERDLTEFLGARTKVTNSKINPIGRHIKLAAILKIDGVDSIAVLKQKIKQGIATKPQALQSIKEKLFNPKYLNISEMKLIGSSLESSSQNQPIIELESEPHPSFPAPFNMMRPQFNFPQGMPQFPFPFQMMKNFLGPNFPANFNFQPHPQHRMNYHQQGPRYQNYHHNQPFHANNFYGNRRGGPRGRYQNQGGRQVGNRYQNNNNQRQAPEQRQENINNKPINTTVANAVNPTPQGPSFNNPKDLKDNLATFLNFDQDKQRTLLGEMLFPLVSKHANQELAPKITGMLIDFSVFEVTDILDFLTNEASLQERVTEAISLIQNPDDSN